MDGHQSAGHAIVTLQPEEVFKMGASQPFPEIPDARSDDLHHLDIIGQKRRVAQRYRQEYRGPENQHDRGQAFIARGTVLPDPVHRLQHYQRR